MTTENRISKSRIFRIINHKPMKYLSILTIVVLLASCASKNESSKDLSAKKKQLSEYKAKAKELAAAIGKLEQEIAVSDTSFKTEQKARLITVAEIQKQDFKHFIEVQGTLDASENITALSQTPGVVTAIYVKEGDHVSKGQLLAITETTNSMQTGIQALQTQLDLATTVFEKQQRLWAQKIGSEIQFLQAKANKESLEKQMTAQLTQLEMTKIKAPVSGIVDEVRLKVGDMAAPSALMPGIRIVNSSNLKIKARLSDTEFGKIKQGDKVQIEFPNTGKVIDEKVGYVQRTIDSRTRTFVVEVNLDNSSNQYAANMLAKLKINDVTMKDVVVVPSNIIQKSAEGLYVLVAENNQGAKTTKRKPVKTGIDYNGQTVITEGLTTGDNIITFGYSELVDGQRIDY